MARVTFPQARYVYDCRKGEALGKHREVRATLVGGQARVYCLSPKPLLAPRLALAGGGVKPGGAVAYTVALPGGSDARKQLVRLTVLRPDGSEYGDYARNLLLGSKAFSGSFRLALNDPPGKWRVVARDLCSSQKATAALTYEQRLADVARAATDGEGVAWKGASVCSQKRIEVAGDPQSVDAPGARQQPGQRSRGRADAAD